MYPSGSSAGQVVAVNPVFACRCQAKVELCDGEKLELKDGPHLVAAHARTDGTRVAILGKSDELAFGGMLQGDNHLVRCEPNGPCYSSVGQ